VQSTIDVAQMLCECELLFAKQMAQRGELAAFGWTCQFFNSAGRGNVQAGLGANMEQ
jgi:hypothetical protein